MRAKLEIGLITVLTLMAIAAPVVNWLLTS